MSKVTWCECDQMPGCHNSVDCDNEMPVENPKEWLKKNICAMIDSEVEVGKTEVEYYFHITADTFSFGQTSNYEIEINKMKGNNLCDCEDWKDKHLDSNGNRRNEIHQYDTNDGCQPDGPDTRAQDHIGIEWKLGSKGVV